MEKNGKGKWKFFFKKSEDFGNVKKEKGILKNAKVKKSKEKLSKAQNFWRRNNIRYFNWKKMGNNPNKKSQKLIIFDVLKNVKKENNQKKSIKKKFSEKKTKKNRK